VTRPKPEKNLAGFRLQRLEQLVAEMIDHDREEARKEAYLLQKGFDVIGPRE
jgi:GDPmannose 4,6-dehydratase